MQYLERVGRKDVQLMGFCMMGLLFFVCGVFRDWFLQEGAPFSRKVLFLVLYSLTFLFRYSLSSSFPLPLSHFLCLSFSQIFLTFYAFLSLSLYLCLLLLSPLLLSLWLQTSFLPSFTAYVYVISITVPIPLSLII